MPLHVRSLLNLVELGKLVEHQTAWAITNIMKAKLKLGIGGAGCKKQQRRYVARKMIFQINK